MTQHSFLDFFFVKIIKNVLHMRFVVYCAFTQAKGNSSKFGGAQDVA